MNEPVVVVGPLVEVVTVAEVREHLRIDHAHEDKWLAAAIRTAREDVEGYVGRALIMQTLEWSTDGWPVDEWLRLPRPPLRSVEWLKWTGATGAVTTVAATEYQVDTLSSPGTVVALRGVGWPTGELAVANGVRVRYVAGYGARAGMVPARIRHAVMMMVGHLYENREATVVVGAPVGELPMGVQRLLYPFRVFL